MLDMVLVKHLARLLNGVDANLEIEGVTGIEVDFEQKMVHLRYISHRDLKPWDGESERFFPNIVGIDDDMDLGTNTTPRIDLGNPDKQSKDRFTPNDAGWTDENEYYYQKFKKGDLQELEEIDVDFGSNTVQP